MDYLENSPLTPPSPPDLGERGRVRGGIFVVWGRPMGHDN